MAFRYPYILTVFILIFLAQNSIAFEKQLIINSDMQYGYAEHLFVQNDYDTALIEFKRFIHFFPDSKIVGQAQFKIAVCLFNLKKYQDAAQVFNEIILCNKENEITKEAYFYQSKSFMHLDNKGYAQIVLQNYLKLAEDQDTIDRIYFNLAQIHLADASDSKPGSLALARNYLAKISESGDSKYKTNLYADLIIKAENASRKNTKAAGLFAIIPGGGFLYCERYHDAFITFLLNAGLIAAAYEAYDNGNVALAAVIGFVETGFYTANIYGSISSAHKYNRAQVLKILNENIFITSSLDPRGRYELLFSYKF